MGPMGPSGPERSSPSSWPEQRLIRTAKFILASGLTGTPQAVNPSADSRKQLAVRVRDAFVILQHGGPRVQ